LFIYPGIAAVFVSLLTPFSIIILLVLISIYDMWAVWKVGIMQKMAKFQMEELKLFGGLLIPSVSKKAKLEIKNIKQKYKNKKIPKKIREKKYKINLAILGGGDIIFPIIASGIFLKFYGLLPALFVTFGALAGLTYLFIITEKGKSYPAMPYISVGIFIGMFLALIFNLL
jgi:presenilin-like A22 family membrane protease